MIAENKNWTVVKLSFFKNFLIGIFAKLSNACNYLFLSDCEFKLKCGQFRTYLVPKIIILTIIIIIIRMIIYLMYNRYSLYLEVKPYLTTHNIIGKWSLVIIMKFKYRILLTICTCLKYDNYEFPCLNFHNP